MAIERQRARTLDDEPYFIVDRAGMRVDVTGSVWKLNDLTSKTNINWNLLSFRDGGPFKTAREFIRSMIESHSTASVVNAFEQLTRAFAQPEIATAVETNSSIGIAFFNRLKQQLGENTYLFHYVKKWYGFGADHAYDGFDPDVAFEIENMRIGGNKKGHAYCLPIRKKVRLTISKLPGCLMLFERRVRPKL